MNNRQNNMTGPVSNETDLDNDKSTSTANTWVPIVLKTSTTGPVIAMSTYVLDRAATQIQTHTPMDFKTNGFRSLFSAMGQSIVKSVPYSHQGKINESVHGVYGEEYVEGKSHSPKIFVSNVIVTTLIDTTFTQILANYRYAADMKLPITVSTPNLYRTLGKGYTIRLTQNGAGAFFFLGSMAALNEFNKDNNNWLKGIGTLLGATVLSGFATNGISVVYKVTFKKFRMGNNQGAIKTACDIFKESGYKGFTKGGLYGAAGTGVAFATFMTWNYLIDHLVAPKVVDIYRSCWENEPATIERRPSRDFSQTKEEASIPAQAAAGVAPHPKQTIAELATFAKQRHDSSLNQDAVEFFNRNGLTNPSFDGRSFSTFLAICAGSENYVTPELVPIYLCFLPTKDQQQIVENVTQRGNEKRSVNQSCLFAKSYLQALQKAAVSKDESMKVGQTREVSPPHMR